MKRLLVLLAALLATWLGVAVPAPTAVALPGNPGSVHGYVYDADRTVASFDNTAIKRGPPVTDERGTISDAVHRWSHGASSRPDGPTPRAQTTYNTRPAFAKATRVAGYNLEPMGLVDGNVIAFARGGVAAKTADNLLPGLPASAPKPLGLGSTGRTVPESLTEQLAMTEVRSAPAGAQLQRVTISDSRWMASDGWVKMQQIVNGVNIHYVRNTVTGAVDDFKFVMRR